ncbi:MAG: G5 domain-containing protein [Clostridia bacterium]|nr:G5 domain-containing protein [Clostridia bacterium]
MQQNGTKELPEVFKELQNIRSMQTQIRVAKKVNKAISGINSIVLEKVIVIATTIICVLIMMPSANSIFAANNMEMNIEYKPLNSFEANQNALNMHNIITTNTGIVETKQLITEEREFDFETEYRENNLLPLGEEKIIQEGIKGKENVTTVQIFKNDEFIEESIIEKEKVADSVVEIIEKGTSEVLFNKKMHIGDTIYLIENVLLLEKPLDTANQLHEIKENLDVILLGIEGEYFKVLHNEKEGYIKLDKLTSSAINPEIVEKNRIQKILMNLEFNMPLNKKSGLTLEDFKKVLSGNLSDKNKTFENHAEVFYNIEQTYNVNGIFIAAVGIHESAWGTSSISLEKKNLFGYGAYDSDPYNSAFEFGEYQEGIELIAKVFVKYYINPKGTKIFEGQEAEASYYNGPTLEGVNKRYSTDEDWCERVYYYMQYLYEKLG